MCVGDSFPVYTVDRKGDLVSDCWKITHHYSVKTALVAKIIDEGYFALQDYK